MILLRSSVLFLLSGIICCQESMHTAPTDNTKLLQTADRQQQPPTLNNNPGDSPKKDDVEKSVESIVKSHESEPKPDGAPDDPQFAARRRLCCQDGRQHFYMNGNCANRSKEKNEAVGMWCDQRFMECCHFLELYYMGPSCCQNKHNEKEKEKSIQPEKATPTVYHESQPKPEDSQQVAAKRRQCCDDGRQHFYVNGNCANRSKEKNEAVGMWCDQKFMECCHFMVLYYMGPRERGRCQNKQNDKINPEDVFTKDKTEKPVLVEGHESQPKPDAKLEDSPIKGEGEKSVEAEKVSHGDGSESEPKPSAPPDSQQVVARRRQCCDDGRQHFYMNGNCANRPREQNEAVGLWCDQKFLECCVFMESYYMGPREGKWHQNKHPPCRVPNPTDTPEKTTIGLN